MICKMNQINDRSKDLAGQSDLIIPWFWIREVHVFPLVVGKYCRVTVLNAVFKMTGTYPVILRCRLPI